MLRRRSLTIFNMAAAPDTVAGASMDVDSNDTGTTQTFHIGTRQSILAKVQTDEVVQALRKAWPEHKYENRTA